jgi:ribosome-binding protein aMBF1 (putative translation factor)
MPKVLSYVNRQNTKYFCQICGTEFSITDVIYIRRNGIELKVCRECSQSQEIIKPEDIKKNTTTPRLGKL